MIFVLKRKTALDICQIVFTKVVNDNNFLDINFNFLSIKINFVELLYHKSYLEYIEFYGI